MPEYRPVQGDSDGYQSDCSRNASGLFAGGQFATVDHMEGSRSIKLKKDEQGQHHYIPASWVTGVENGKVVVDRPGDEAMNDWKNTPM